MSLCSNIILKRETRKLYVLNRDYLLIQELSLDEMRWRVIRPRFSVEMRDAVWVDLPYTPLGLLISASSLVFALNLEAPDDVREVGGVWGLMQRNYLLADKDEGCLLTFYCEDIRHFKLSLV
mmetsp:Transcript_6650/g.11735  ORF Transcript_6650/g.11735 Transcript_6650/m.11735 type:complete len:122 (-) Transcript_6650:46-411(-)